MADLNTTYNDNVAIAMATYNGEKYLAAFSSIAQSAYGASVCRFWMISQEHTGTSAF